MTNNPAKVIAPAALHTLKEALSAVYWYKSDLRSFLTNSLSDPQVLARVNWEDFKRSIVGAVVDHLSSNQDVYQADLLRLMTEVARMESFAHLERLEDGPAKAKAAKDAVAALRTMIRPHAALMAQEAEKEERRATALEERLKQGAVREQLSSLETRFGHLLGEEPQKRGYALEVLMRDLFNLFDLDPKSSFKVVGEQIDGAFTFDSTDYLFEAKWQNAPTAVQELDALSGKFSRRLENTLGLLLSINGFSEDAPKVHSSGRSSIVLMDGSDLMAVLEGRIDLIQLLLRKRRHAAQTGNIYLRIHEVLG